MSNVSITGTRPIRFFKGDSIFSRHMRTFLDERWLDLPWYLLKGQERQCSANPPRLLILSNG